MGWFDDVTDSLGLTQHGAKKAHSKQMKQLQALFSQLQGQQAGFYGAAGGQLKKALGAINTGYGNALANTGLQATNARRSTLDREQQQIGGASQSLANRGLYNTTLLDNAKRGITSSTNRELSNIDAMLGQLQSQLEIGRAGAQAGAYGSLAQLFQNQAGASTGLGLNKAQMMYGSPAPTTIAQGGGIDLASSLAFFMGGGMPGGGGGGYHYPGTFVGAPY